MTGASQDAERAEQAKMQRNQESLASALEDVLSRDQKEDEKSDMSCILRIDAMVAIDC